jgi:hypothetical protein
MLWFLIHNIFKNFTSMESQTRNLTTFLTGTVLYVLFYSYVGSLDIIHDSFLKRLFGYFICIVMADGFSMALIYKNFYKQTIFTEANQTIGTSGPKMTATDVEPIETVEANVHIPTQNTSESIPLLNNESEYIDENEGFTKDSALGNTYNTNGNSNA